MNELEHLEGQLSDLYTHLSAATEGVRALKKRIKKLEAEIEEREGDGKDECDQGCRYGP